jgi:hypothetical protein
VCVSESQTSLDDSRANAAAVAQPQLGKHGDVGVLSENGDIFSTTVRLRTVVTLVLLVCPKILRRRALYLYKYYLAVVC